MDRAEILDATRRCFAGRTDVAAAWVFGSVARDRMQSNSDVDVGVLLTAAAPLRFEDHAPIATLQADLETALHRDVDVVPMNDAPPDLLHRILRDGVLVHETDHRRRIEFEVQSRNAYWDLLPILEQYRRAMLRRA